jgi:monooxygenase
VCEYVCRLLGHMRERGYDAVTPLAPDPSQPTRPFLDLNSGYVQRSMDSFPRQGAATPWRLNQNYPRDVRLLRYGPVEDAGVRFSRAGSRILTPAEQPLAA